MIDPNKITDFSRSSADLLEFWLFCLFVRGKNADTQAKKLAKFIQLVGGISGVHKLSNSSLESFLRNVGAGQYHTLVPAISQTLDRLSENPHFLNRAPVCDLEKIYGVGPKTARFFVLHSRKKARVAVLDTHTS